MTDPDHGTPEWWDSFWRQHHAGALVAHADHWHGVIWDYALNRLHELFETHAPGRRILECGCGSARVSQFLALRGYHCTLLDYSEPALAVARERFTSQGLHARYVQADLMNLPFQPASFDIVYSGGVLEFFGDLKRPVAEMARVLGGGGVFAADMVPRKFSIQTIADIERTLVYSARHLVRGRVREALSLTSSTPAAYGIQPWTLGDYVAACSAAGFQQPRARVISPFPALALPKFAQRAYARAMSALTPQWRRFDDSTAKWTETLGIAYRISASKRAPSSGAE
jgi:SAM-dependent methyltransferase